MLLTTLLCLERSTPAMMSDLFSLAASASDSASDAFSYRV
jgi:hypothetical protein